MSRLALAATFALTACVTPVHSADPAFRGPWQLTFLDGAPFAATSTLWFDEDGNLAGQAPCNRWSATNAARLPDLQLSDIVATEMACDALAEETVFFQSLAAMDTATLQGRDVLMLAGPDGERLVFNRLVVILDN
jgi:heat shock protein HslJ